MAKQEQAVRYDKDGAVRTMRAGDYLADMSGQLALGIMANLVGQMNYFYTDKVGMSVGAVGVVMAIAKVVNAFTDVIFGNVIDHSRGGNKKYYRWIITLAVPAAAIVAMMFMLPAGAATGVQVAYALITNLLLTAVIYTMIATPFSAVMVVRTKSQSERGSMGVFRAVGNYGAGMLIAIMTIPVTNMLGGTQSAWIKYGVILGAAVLLFNLITAITSAIAASSGTYYCQWLLGHDNPVGLLGAAGMLATVIGFVLSKPIIAKLGVTRTVSWGCLGAAIAAGVRCFAPANFTMYVVTSLIGSFVQIPLMCLYGVLVAMAVDYNEWKFDKKLVAMSGGAIGFGNKVGSGLGSLVLSAFLLIGSYDPSLAAATTSMRWSIYGFSNFLPVVINVLMFFIFRGFDLEEKLPKMREEVAARRANR